MTASEEERPCRPAGGRMALADGLRDLSRLFLVAGHLRRCDRPENVCPDYAGSMQIQPIDARDTEIAIDSPTYRVFFWERHGIHESATSGFTSSEYEINDARDVHEMLRWAEVNAGNRTFTAYVVVNKALVRLSGQDPTRSNSS